MRVFSPVENAKYLYVARNPYDCAVSFYHFLKGFTPKTFTDVSFERFLTLFLSGKALYGDYFDHLLPWYERRNDANVLFLTYEELKADTRSQVLKIAEFVGEYHAAALREHDDVLQDVMNASSLENMRAFFSEMPLETVMKVAAKASYNSFCAELLKNLPRGIDEMHEGAGFVRKGIVGDWRNYFTPEQIIQMKDRIARKTRGSDVMTIWNDCDLP
ncbi:amine sulfotransferase [Rhipicephalus sanguineus]|uniref:amine sulfotransferase n=1 Tax=Rhipicephalus sanguineus TaxID=34632 RepID=UPI001894A2EC|nr:amine sulfotransferase [Rhipicephalus sanguineus]